MHSSYNIDFASLLNLPFGIFRVDRDNHTIECNDRHAEVMGLNSRRDYFGLTNYDLLTSE